MRFDQPGPFTDASAHILAKAAGDPAEKPATKMAWKTLVAKSNFADWPDCGMAKKGYIGLQEYGFKVEFKNIKIKVLS